MFADVFSDKEFIRKLCRLTFPIALQSLMLALVAAADAIMLGRVDQDSMAAVSLATQIQFVQAMLFYTIVSGVTILGAQYWGKRDMGSLADIFCISLRLSCALSVLFFIGCAFYPKNLMRLFASDPHLIDIGASYLKIASWSYLIVGISQCYLATMKVSEQADQAAWISSGTVILNIILNAIFIFGFHRVPAMGANGAALATTLSRIVELVWCIGASFRKDGIPLEPRRLFHWRRELSRDFCKCILPILGGASAWGVGFASYTAIMGHLGSDAAAANSSAAVVRDLMCCLCNGVGTAGGIIIGHELGAGNLMRGRLYGDRLMIVSYIIGVFSTVIVLATIPLALHYMKLTPVAKSYLVGMYVIMAIYMIGRCVNTVVINGIFAAGGDTLFDMYSLLVAMWGLAIPLSLAGAFWFHFPVLVVYGCTCLDEVGKIPWVMQHYWKYKWVKNLTRD